jgi:hypothetical protein
VCRSCGRRRLGRLGLLGAIVLSGCGGSGVSTSESLPGTIAALLNRPGENVAITPGTSSHVPGPIRVSFLVIRGDGRAVERPQARVWIATGLKAKPYGHGIAVLEPIGVPGMRKETEGHPARIYVAHLSAPKPGKYWLLAEPVGAAQAVQALGNVVVAAESTEPGVGQKAIPSRTPTIESERGNLARLTTASPPDRALLRHSVAESLAAHVPFVVTFATPEFCTSRTCGPVVDVVEAVRRRFARSRVRFIHVEIYRNNDPGAGFNRWVKEWRLPTEPWTFLVARDGRIKAKFEGPVSVRELTRSVRKHLL